MPPSKLREEAQEQASQAEQAQSPAQKAPMNKAKLYAKLARWKHMDFTLPDQSIYRYKLHLLPSLPPSFHVEREDI